LLPTSVLVAFTRNQARTIDFAASNLRGSPVPLYLAGAGIVANYPFGPRAGAALNITTLGYGDALDIGVNVDPAAVADVDGLMLDIADAFDVLVG
jgi:diacylglycerol O-acyltransferase / wax synthase